MQIQGEHANSTQKGLLATNETQDILAMKEQCLPLKKNLSHSNHALKKVLSPHDTSKLQVIICKLGAV